MPVYAYVLVIAGPLLWCAPFPFVRIKQRGPLTLDKRARWGIALVCLGYTLLWQGQFWTRSPEPWRLAVSSALFALACLISWTAARALGRQMRLDAAVDSHHELVRSGPYGLMRHPIYTSMLCVMLGTGVLLSPVYMFVPALLIFAIGTAIRVRVEDRLLAARFGDQFAEYRREVPPLLPYKFKWRRA